MRKEGFTFTSHKKGLYFDGHDHPDVVEYRQNIFIKAIDGVKKRLIRFSYQNIDSVMPQSNFVEWKLVLCAHDEMTAQANDSRAKYWVFKDQHALRKKGAGRCRTLNGSIEGSGVYGSHSGSLLLRVAFYGYVPLASRLTYFVLHCAASIAPTPMPTASRLVFPRLIL